MSVPSYEGDEEERNLKHALLNISADIATVVTTTVSVAVSSIYWKRIARVQHVTKRGAFGAAVFGLLSSVGSETAS